MPSYVTDANLSSRELAFCGGMAGVVSRAVIAPLDVVKIRMQLQTHRTQFGFKQKTRSNVKYPNIHQSLLTILREEGIRGLYKGNMPAEYLYLSYSAVEFWAYKELEQGIELIDKKHKLPNALNTFGCGMIAGCIATASTYPFDLLRTRFAGQRGSEKYTSVTRAVLDIYKGEGIYGFYRGLWPTIIQIMPYMGFLFSTYDMFAKGFKKLRNDQVLSSHYKPTHDMLSGALSGLTSKMAVYPFDLVRKRLQMERSMTSSSWWSYLKSVVRKEGFASLYKGLGPTLIKVAPANAVTFMVFEETKDALLWFKEK